MRASIKIYTLIADMQKAEKLDIPPVNIEVRTRLFVDEIECITEDLDADGHDIGENVVISTRSGDTHITKMKFEQLDKLIDKAYGIIQSKKQPDNNRASGTCNSGVSGDLGEGLK
jgi:hypothetical protein